MFVCIVDRVLTKLEAKLVSLVGIKAELLKPEGSNMCGMGTDPPTPNKAYTWG